MHVCATCASACTVPLSFYECLHILMRNVVLHQIDIKTDMHAVKSMHTDSHGSHAAQATAIACVCMRMHTSIVPIEPFCSVHLNFVCDTIVLL